MRLSNTMKTILTGTILCSMFLTGCSQNQTSNQHDSPQYSLEDIQNGDIIKLGKPDETIAFTGEFIVLDAEKTNTLDNGIFLLSKDLIGSSNDSGMLYRNIGKDIVVTFDDRGESYAAEHPDVQNYQGSDIQLWCQDFMTSHFSEAEQNAFIKTYKSDATYKKEISFNGIETTVDFDDAENILNGDQMFLLSAEEATNPNYGFADDNSRIAYLGEETGLWWLRSPHSPTFPLDVGIVFNNGSVMDFPVNAETGFSVKVLTCARPACNLDTSKISTISKLDETSDGHSIWELSFE